MNQTYLDKIKALVATQPELTTPGLHHVNVAHDDWCRLLKGKGECNCNPDVVVAK